MSIMAEHTKRTTTMNEKDIYLHTYCLLEQNKIKTCRSYRGKGVENFIQTFTFFW
jgi:hypothetical protein